MLPFTECICKQVNGIGPSERGMWSLFHIHLRCHSVVPCVDCPLLESGGSGSGAETAQGLCLYWDCCLLLLTACP